MDEEGEDVAPAKKKARPSEERDDVDDSEEEPIKPTRARRSKRTTVKMEIDEDEVVSLPSKGTSEKGRGGRKAGVKKVVVEEEVVEDMEEEQEDVKPLARAGRRSKEAAEPVEDPPRGSGKQSKNPRSKKRVSIQEPTKEEESESEDDIEVIPLRKSQKAPSTNNEPKEPSPVEEEEGEEEEERSLFEPVPMPAPESLPQPMPEQPSGPQARLVIHKIVLVNFKSYAGRQEIGPFHKVS